MTSYHSSTNDLPTTVLLLPLQDAILMPKMLITIPMLMQEYMNLALGDPATCSGQDYVGIVQMVADEPLFDYKKMPEDQAQYYKTGCLGQILDITETPYDNVILTIMGECRFKLTEIHETQSSNFRIGKVDYATYTMDMIQEADFELNRTYIMQMLQTYFRAIDVKPNWDEINSLSNSKLVTSLAMECPLPMNEKQAIMDEPLIKRQSHLLQSFLEHSILANAYNQPQSRYIH